MEKKQNGPVPIVLDTDIGPDCDDTGALAALHALERRGEADILGVMHCTSSPWGAGCIDAINAYYGRGDIPVGTLKQPGFLETHSRSNYNEAIARRYPNRYCREEAPDAVAEYRRLLAGQKDESVVIAAIGPLRNLRLLLESAPDRWSELDGTALVARKVRRLVAMGGRFPEGMEWNFEMDPASARCVADRWPTPITFCGAEIGDSLLTGARFKRDAPVDHPVRKAYELYLQGEPDRPSWDQATVLCAVRGASDYWERSAAGKAKVRTDGSNGWQSGEGGSHDYLMRKMPDATLAELLEDLMLDK
ncbi:nucleoside hydrolase [Cohnella nanjingensis]|uniref:Nucleoside hydrolase n=1 Tax=Cohnella nanjingensis TaxID=1387779 RepID=A0A7X0RS75_9BACL|nr:nucleoside hydrolase [Cohnella nanjingensis]MBB6672523.1 nucleoside hydrolase [Cohnella nanjingensis]